nr:MAG TPA: Protein of unknown function (DUF1642) [Caudoviricetes sp.]
MNKQELIEKIGNLDKLYGETFYVALDDVLDLVKQLDEPQPVKVKQFVADWYEENKDSFEFNVWDWIAFRDEAEKLENREFNNWINNSRENPIQTLVNMHQFGYEVEEEKRYFVKITAAEQYLVRVEDENFLGFLQSRLRSKFTRKQLEEAGFGWVFNCEGIEIEEVEG